MKYFLYLMGVCFALELTCACKKSSSSSPSPSRLHDTTTYLITQFGAMGDGITINTSNIQRAIDSCSGIGGGIVAVPPGQFVTGTIYLKTGVTLNVQAGATLLGSPSILQYPENRNPYIGGKNMALVVAIDAQNIGITGPGTIDGRGGSPGFHISGDETSRPRLIHFIHCQHIQVSNINLRNAASWVEYYFYCQDVHLDSVNVNSYANINNDGIDIDAQDVTVSNCTIHSEDDGICLKSNAPVPCKNVQISNCTVASDCNGIKMGTGSTTGFMNISIQHCQVSSHISGVALEVVDGGVMDQVTVDDIAMAGVPTPLFIKLGDRSRRNPDSLHLPGKLQNVAISNIHAGSTSRMSSSITGFPGYYAQNILIRDSYLNGPGGGTAADTSRVIPENQGQYPEIYMFGPSLPAYGLYIRHATQINLQNITLGFQATDVRPAILFDDVRGAVGTGLQMQPPSYGVNPVKIVNSTNISIQ